MATLNAYDLVSEKMKDALSDDELERISGGLRGGGGDDDRSFHYDSPRQFHYDSPRQFHYDSPRRG